MLDSIGISRLGHKKTPALSFIAYSQFVCASLVTARKLRPAWVEVERGKNTSNRVRKKRKRKKRETPSSHVLLAPRLVALPLDPFIHRFAHLIPRSLPHAVFNTAQASLFSLSPPSSPPLLLFIPSPFLLFSLLLLLLPPSHPTQLAARHHEEQYLQSYRIVDLHRGFSPDSRWPFSTWRLIDSETTTHPPTVG